MIRSPDLSDPNRYDAFQTFLLDLQFAPQVAAAFSIFSLPKADEAASQIDQGEQDDGADQPVFFLTSPDIRSLPISERLARLRKEVPLADKMLSDDFQVTVIALMSAPAEDGAHPHH